MFKPPQTNRAIEAGLSGFQWDGPNCSAVKAEQSLILGGTARMWTVLTSAPGGSMGQFSPGDVKGSGGVCHIEANQKLTDKV